MPEKIFIPSHTPIIPVKSGDHIQSKHSKNEKNNSFGQIFQQQLKKENSLKFSAHAEKRLQQRNITLDAEKMAKLAGAVERAEAKGAKESLILMNDLAFVVSVPNKTVITAMDQGSTKDNVFTNIDSAVII